MEHIVQYQYGEGDNVGRDKIVNNYIGKSVEYSDLQQRITDKQLLLSYIPEVKVAERLRISEELNALIEQEKQFKKEVFSLYETFTRIEINTDRLRLAQQHFEAGEFREARAAMDKDQMIIELVAILEQEESLLKKLKKNQQLLIEKSNEYLILARLTALDFELIDRLQQTEYYFKQSLELNRNHNNLFVYAVFLLEHKQINLAYGLFKEVLLIFRRFEKEDTLKWAPLISAVLSNLANIHCERKEYSIAQIVHEEAIRKLRQVAKTIPQNWLVSFAGTTINVSYFYLKDMPDKEKSLAYAKEAFHAALPFKEDLVLAQEIVDIAKTIIEAWGMDVEEFLVNKGIAKH